MKVYTNKSGKVTKYVHDNGAETIIKELGRNNKFSVFISISKGCSRGCDFCGITVDKIPYKKIAIEQIIYDTTAAVFHQLEQRPELKEKYIKLCFMGMGEIASLPPGALYDIGEALIETLAPHTAGIDSVDISSSVMFKRSQVEEMMDLQDFIIDLITFAGLPVNQAYDYQACERSFVRSQA